MGVEWSPLSSESRSVHLDGEQESEKWEESVRQREQHGEGTRPGREEVCRCLPVVPTWAGWGLVLDTVDDPDLHPQGTGGGIRSGPGDIWKEEADTPGPGETRGRALQGSPQACEAFL